MTKLGLWVTVAAGAIGGFIASYLGGWDFLLRGMIAAVLLDVATGLIKGAVTVGLSSEIFKEGILKKLLLFLAVAGAVVAETILGDQIPLRDGIISAFIAMEVLSMFENIGAVIKLPNVFTKIIASLKNIAEGK